MVFHLLRTLSSTSEPHTMCARGTWEGHSAESTDCRVYRLCQKTWRAGVRACGRAGVRTKLAGSMPDDFWFCRCFYRCFYRYFFWFLGFRYVLAGTNQRRAYKWCFPALHGRTVWADRHVPTGKTSLFCVYSHLVNNEASLPGPQC